MPLLPQTTEQKLRPSLRRRQRVQNQDRSPDSLTHTPVSAASLTERGLAVQSENTTTPLAQNGPKFFRLKLKVGAGTQLWVLPDLLHQPWPR